MTSKRVLWGASLALKMEKVPSKRLSKKYIGKIPKIAKKWLHNGQLPLSFLGTFLMIFSRGASTPENHVFFAKNHCFLYKNAVVLANPCVQNYTHGPPSPHKLARRYTGLPAQYINISWHIPDIPVGWVCSGDPCWILITNSTAGGRGPTKACLRNRVAAELWTY